MRCRLNTGSWFVGRRGVGTAGRRCDRRRGFVGFCDRMTRDYGRMDIPFKWLVDLYRGLEDGLPNNNTLLS